MEQRFQASYLTAFGRQRDLSLSLSAAAGENLCLLGTESRRRVHFSVLCGLQKPKMGNVTIGGRILYDMPPRELGCFRRNHIGGVLPQLLPGLSLPDQIALPMVLAGAEKSAIRDRLRVLGAGELDGKKPRDRARAALLRALVMEPEVIVVQGLMEEFDDLDADLLWETLSSHRREDSVLLYLSGGPVPERITWNRRVPI